MTPDCPGPPPARPRPATILCSSNPSKAMAVLSAFGPDRAALGLADIAAATGIGKSAAQRFTHTLEALGYLKREQASRRYVLAPRMLELGLRYVHADPLVEHANPFLAELNRRCMETINLWRPDRNEMICVARFPGFKQVTSHMPLGKRLPMFCTAAGRAYLSGLNEQEIAPVLASAPLQAFTPATVTDPARLTELIRQAGRDGYASAVDEYYRGDIAIGAPVLDRSGRPVAAINISVALTRWKPADAIAELAPFAIEAAREISGAA